MPLTFDPTFEDVIQKNNLINQEIESLKRFITPDDELLDGQDMIGYRLEREKASVDEITEMLNKKTYHDPKLSEEQNNQKKEELKAQIKEHQSDIKNLQKQRREIPKAIERLENIKNSDKSDIGVFKISKDSTREEIKAILKDVEARLEKTNLPSEKRMLNYLRGHLESAKTTIDTGKELQDTYLFLHQSELKNLGKIPALKPVQTSVAVNMLDNILQHLTNEQDRLKQKGSPLHQTFAEPIAKISERVKEVKQNPALIHDKAKMNDTVSTVVRLNHTLQREKEASPSFKDRLRNLVNGFRSFMENVFGVKIAEVESLKSKTLTNMFDTQKEAHRLARVVPKNDNRDNAKNDNPRPRM